MPSKDSPAMLVARFLQANRYEETLAAYLADAGLPPDAGSIKPGDLTIENVLEEKKIFDLSLRFEKTGIQGEDKEGWTTPAPSISTSIESLLSSSNVLHVSFDIIFGLKDGLEGFGIYLILTTADKRLSILSAESDAPLINSLSTLHDSPILSTTILQDRYLLSSSMSGQVQLTLLSTMELLSTRQDHSKYVVKVTSFEHEDHVWVATAGWDQKVLLYDLDLSCPSASSFSSPIATLTLPTNPEDIMFLDPTATRPLTLLLTRRDNAHLHYYSLPSLTLLGSQNLAPHSNAWISFSPSSIALSPNDRSLLAVGTSSLPYMKLLFVRLLFPHPPSPTDPQPPAAPETQSSQARLALEIANRESEAIQKHVSTGAPQTPYSTPQVCWRPCGTGVWVNGDDGVIRGVEFRTGEVVAVLRGGHEAGSKIRSICVGYLRGGRECVLSGGFDRKALIWSSPAAQ